MIVHSTGSKTLITESPPLFPILLGSVTAIFGDVVEVSRWLNIAFFGGSVFLVGYILHAYTKCLVLSGIASLVFSTNPQMILVFSGMMSEPFFIFCLLLILFFTLRYLKTERVSHFATLIFLSAALPLIRYAGIVFVFSIGIILFIYQSGNLACKIKKAGIYYATALPPILSWFLYLYLKFNKIGGKDFLFSNRFPQRLIMSILEEFEVVRSWVPYFDIYADTEIGLALILVALTILITLAVWSLLKYSTAKEKHPQAVFRLIWIPFAWIIAYGLFIAITHATSSPQIDIIDRMMAPLFPLTLIYVAAGVAFLFQKKNQFANIFFLFLSLIGIRYYYLKSSALVQDLEKEGMGFTAAKYQRSGIISALHALPNDLPMASNSPGFVLFYTNRYPYQIDYFQNHPFGSGNGYGEKSFRENSAALILLYDDFHNYYGENSASLLHTITQGLDVHYQDPMAGIYFYPR